MTDGTRPTHDALFGVLANETRLRIVEALGDLSEPGEYSTIPFSELQEAVGVEDNGKFSYHLNKLTGYFVVRSEGGYRLELPGIRVYQALQFWLQEPVTVEPHHMGYVCDFCEEGGLSISYRDGRYHVGCRDCGTKYQEYPLSAAAFDPDDPESLERAAVRRSWQDKFAFLQAVCPYCSGPVWRSVEGGDRIPTPPCEDAHVSMLHSCDRCNWFIHTYAGAVMTIHPAAVSFFYERGVDIYETPPWDNVYTQLEQVESTDPLRIESRYLCAGDELRLLFDESLDVLESVVVEDVSSDSQIKQVARGGGLAEFAEDDG
ncbi:ArsR/SmtB family transcription factor [Halobium salinum]|uniref:ArsR/SmtB family transcription factor n=1 Tax=Halobium salinum TaxID=1364940 RepID=A0ABD5P981_9EURY|nr:hypothetical protein [Halobium salinum]